VPVSGTARPDLPPGSPDLGFTRRLARVSSPDARSGTGCALGEKATDETRKPRDRWIGSASRGTGDE
jgi:hypothetical protein